MKNSVFKAALALLLACATLLPASCATVDPLATSANVWNNTTKSTVESVTESTPDGGDYIIRRPANVDLSEYDLGEDAGVGRYVDGDWMYIRRYGSSYFIYDKRIYLEKELTTAYKYNIVTRACVPVCGDPVCRHSTNEETSECPFAGGFRLIAIDGDKLYFVSRYPSSEDDSLTTYHPSIYVYNTKTLEKTYLFSSFRFMAEDDYFDLVDGKIYYVEDVLVGDYTFDRYLCAYELKSGKTARLLKYDHYYFEDPSYISNTTVRYEHGLYIRSVASDGIACFSTIPTPFKTTTEEGLEVWDTEKTRRVYTVDINDINTLREVPNSDYNHGFVGMRKGKLYLLDRAEYETVLCDVTLYEVDVQSGEKRILEENFTGSPLICGDTLIFIKENSLYMRNLETGKERLFDLPACVEGELVKKADTGVGGYKDGRVFLNGFQYNGHEDDSDAEIVVFDLVTNQLYPLHYVFGSVFFQSRYKGEQ